MIFTLSTLLPIHIPYISTLLTSKKSNSSQLALKNTQTIIFRKMEECHQNMVSQELQSVLILNNLELEMINTQKSSKKFSETQLMHTLIMSLF